MSALSVQQVISNYVGKPVSAEQSLEIGLGLSLNELYDLAVDLEEEFEVMISDSIVMGWVTVQDVINFVSARTVK